MRAVSFVQIRATAGGFRARSWLAVASLLAVFGSSAQAATWAINEDYKQLDMRGATDFEILFRGNVAGQITGGGMSGVTNPFANPTRTASMDAFGNTIVRFAGSNSIPQDAGANRHFGIFGEGRKPQALAKAWSFPTAPARVPVPKSNFAFTWFPDTSALQITVENTSPDTVTFADVGYRLSSTEVTIDQLNRTGLPPTSFSSLSSLNREYAPGESDSVFISGVSGSMFALTYATVAFSGESALTNAYDGTGGEWAEVLVSANAIPEPAVALLVLSGLIGLALIRRKALWLLALPLAFALVRGAGADAFVLPLRPPVHDDFPTVTIGATVGGMQVNVDNVIIDTGASSGLFLNPASATALGMNPMGGAAAVGRGVGNAASPIRTGVPTPGGLAPSGASSAVAPMGQAAQNPALPGTATVGALPATVNGLIGSSFLNAYNYGRIDGYFFLALKTQGAGGLSTATSIASFLALGAPFVAGADGKPLGAQNNIVIPTPVQPLPPGTTQHDQGFDLPTDATNPTSGATAEDQAFLIRSGLPMTLISQSLAQQLGLTLGPTVETLGDFGTIDVAQADLELALFADPSFPAFTLPVGVLSDSDNPLGMNYLGGDVLGQLPYWEVSEDGTTTRFYAVASINAVPEPETWLLLAMGLAAIGVWGRRRPAMRG